MKISPWKQIEMDAAKEKVLFLHKNGFSVYEIGKMFGKSHEWAAKIVRAHKKLSTTKT